MTMSRTPNVLLRATDDITGPVSSMLQCCAFGTCEFFHMAAEGSPEGEIASSYYAAPVRFSNRTS